MARFGIYTCNPTTTGQPGAIREIAEAETTGGIGQAIVTLAEEGEIDGRDRIGIQDREARVWIVNPWAKGGRA